jgi:hypothetical protein
VKQSCSEQCRAAAEPLAGSGGSASAWIALAWPKPLWDPEEIERSKGLPSQLATLAGEAKQRGDKLALRLFQRSARPSTESVELVLARAGEAYAAVDVPLAEVAGLARAFLRREPLGPRASALGPQVFVCTDGRHDACCARLGRPLYDALLRAREATGARVGVAEVSHLGGHRFAANCLVLPAGELYGRVQPEEAHTLLDAAARGSCWPARLRGRLGADELAQVAEAYAREHGLADPKIQPADALVSDGRARVRVDAGPAGRFWVACARRPYTGQASCGDEPAEERLRWVACALEADA